MWQVVKKTAQFGPFVSDFIKISPKITRLSIEEHKLDRRTDERKKWNKFNAKIFIIKSQKGQMRK